MIYAMTHVIAPVIDCRTPFSVHRFGSPGPTGNPIVISMYLVCGYLSSSTKRQRSVAQKPLVTGR
jgi:hypothetical protein